MNTDFPSMVGRLRGSLPAKWFSDDAPVLDAVLAGLATTWCWLLEFQLYLRRQTRLATIEGTWLDLFADDFLGGAIRRKDRELDNDFRRRVQQEIFRERATRNALRAALVDLTGREPVIFEPANCLDTGGLGSDDGKSGGGLVYGLRGGWGSLQLPYQVFITAHRPVAGGIAVVPGWGSPGGSYCGGTSVLCDLASSAQQVTDTDIYAAVERVLPAATIAWTRIAA
jgi:hypothetical protein